MVFFFVWYSLEDPSIQFHWLKGCSLKLKGVAHSQTQHLIYSAYWTADKQHMQILIM